MTSTSDHNYCRLCEQERPLVRSHIVPAFVFRWLKDTSVTGHIRFGEHPNKRVQDGTKTPMLCAECEALFSEWENQFSKNTFLPTHNDEKPSPEYKAWMLKFAVSLCWRVLKFYNELGLEHLSEVQLDFASRAEEMWRAFLKGEVRHPGKFEQHLITFDLVTGFHGFEPPSNINRYILRAVDMDVVTLGEDECFVFVKLCKFVLIGFIEIKRKDDWKGTRLSVHNGSLYRSKYTLPKWFNEYFLSKARKAQEIQRSMSLRQHDKIGKAYMDNIDKFKDSKMRTALDQDIIFFGTDAFFDPDDE